eukprot:5786531-Alexandrium_andersonii.AAC.1
MSSTAGALVGKSATATSDNSGRRSAKQLMSTGHASRPSPPGRTRFWRRGATSANWKNIFWKSASPRWSCAAKPAGAAPASSARCCGPRLATVTGSAPRGTALAE